MIRTSSRNATNAASRPVPLPSSKSSVMVAQTRRERPMSNNQKQNAPTAPYPCSDHPVGAALPPSRLVASHSLGTLASWDAVVSIGHTIDGTSIMGWDGTRRRSRSQHSLNAKQDHLLLPDVPVTWAVNSKSNHKACLCNVPYDPLLWFPPGEASTEHRRGAHAQSHCRRRLLTYTTSRFMQQVATATCHSKS